MKKLLPILLVALVVLLGAALSAEAGCVCRCVNGRMVPLCTSSLDIPPPCYGICAPPPPSIQPIQPPRIPPIGTSRCRQAQVLNPYTGQYEWRTVCD